MDQVQNASQFLIRSVQQSVYSEEIEDINLQKESRIPLDHQLRLYIDENGLLQSGSRIDNASIFTLDDRP